MRGAKAALVGSVLLASSSARGQQVVATYDEQGTANTPLAGGALQIEAHVELQRWNTGLVLSVRVTTTNRAVSDGGGGCVRVGLLSRGGVVSTFAACSPHARGTFLGRPRPQTGFAQYAVPRGLRFSSLGFRFYNREHGGESMDWARTAGVAARAFFGM